MENKGINITENEERKDSVPFVLSKDDVLTLVNDDFINFLSTVDERIIPNVFNSYINACGIFIFTKALGKILETIKNIKLKDIVVKNGSLVKIDKVYLDVNGTIEEVDVSEPYKVNSKITLAIANDLSLAHGILKLSSLIGEDKLEASYKYMRMSEDVESL